MPLGWTVLAGPPSPSASGLRGATASVAPPQTASRGVALSRPRAGAFITSMNPDPRTAIPMRATRPAEINLPDSQEVVIYAPHRPIRARIAVQYQGKMVVEMWRDRLKQAFDYFDRDKDGDLNGFETQNIFSDTGLVMMLQNGFYQPTPQDRPTLEKLDTDGDRKIVR